MTQPFYIYSTYLCLFSLLICKITFFCWLSLKKVVGLCYILFNLTLLPGLIQMYMRNAKLECSVLVWFLVSLPSHAHKFKLKDWKKAFFILSTYIYSSKISGKLLWIKLATKVFLNEIMVHFEPFGNFNSNFSEN